MPLGRQLEGLLRDAIRSGRLPSGAHLPSTRDLARQLEVSRPLVGDCYSRLAAEGFLALRQGAVPRVAAIELAASPAEQPAERAFRYDFRPGPLDPSAFPKAGWLKSTRAALDDLSADDPAMAGQALREALAEYLGRARGLRCDAGRVLPSANLGSARALAYRLLRQQGRRLLAVARAQLDDFGAARGAGLDVIGIEADADGLDIAALARSGADAVFLAPPPAGQRRADLARWLEASGALVVEYDQGTELRHDDEPAAAFQPLAPDQVICIGRPARTLDPATRLAWLVAPADLVAPLRDLQHQAGDTCAALELHALTHFLRSGAYDQHIWQARSEFRRRRDTLLAALAQHLPGAPALPPRAAMQVRVSLPHPLERDALAAALARFGLGIDLGQAAGEVTTLTLSYARLRDAALRSGLKALASAIAAAPSDEACETVPNLAAE